MACSELGIRYTPENSVSVTFCCWPECEPAKGEEFVALNRINLPQPVALASSEEVKHPPLFLTPPNPLRRLLASTTILRRRKSLQLLWHWGAQIIDKMWRDHKLSRFLRQSSRFSLINVLWCIKGLQLNACDLCSSLTWEESTRLNYSTLLDANKSYSDSPHYYYYAILHQCSTAQHLHVWAIAVCILWCF